MKQAKPKKDKAARKTVCYYPKCKSAVPNGLRFFCEKHRQWFCQEYGKAR